MEKQKAPEFSLLDEKGTRYTSRSLAGSRYLLYFYPKDSTPGCTAEACNFRDTIDEFQKFGIQVFGVSKDPKASHMRFKQKHGLNFPLLIDRQGEVAQKYGVLKEKIVFGRKYTGIERCTFLIDREGFIENKWEHVNPLTHTRQLLDYLGAVS